MTQWTGDVPELGWVGVQVHPDGTGADELQRAYRVVGFEEGRTRANFRLVMERIEWHPVLAGAVSDYPTFFSFYNVPRGG